MAFDFYIRVPLVKLSSLDILLTCIQPPQRNSYDLEWTRSLLRTEVFHESVLAHARRKYGVVILHINLTIIYIYFYLLFFHSFGISPTLTIFKVYFIKRIRKTWSISDPGGSTRKTEHHHVQSTE
jgi:hypothetical protein